ncbi:3'(2'),5'-bisphosphate nucleotidase CysQ, partial [Klebsiella pneumoniae]|nr:3'(2'),5'-bisphosphate nucleotidase CysQ [Klebsiella pneumoniae]
MRDTVKIANLLEKATGEKFIRMEMGVPGLAPSRIGTEAEIEALKHGVAQFYPMLEGYPVLSEEAPQSWDERQHWQRYWLVDPLDGTKEFIKRNGEFTVNIALI